MEGFFSFGSTQIPRALEIGPDGEWITACTVEVLLLLLLLFPNETVFGEVPVRLGVATEEKPIFPLDLFDPIPVVVFGNPESVGHVWFRRPLVAVSQPSLGKGPA